MSNVKFANITRLMTTFNLEFVTETLSDNLKCVKCKLVLNDACQVPCGCRFCRICINDLVVSGSEFCPGVSKNCGESLLSDFVTDYRANISVTQLTVKCPQNGCLHKCELGELEVHMRVCGRKCVVCPFRELGCQQDKLAAEEMSRHFQQENLSHCEILIGMIADINREMDSHNREIEMVKKNDESRKMENEMLKHELVLKDEKIKSIMDQMEHMKNEIKSLKKEKADVIDRVRILSEKINGEIDERRESDERAMLNVIEHVDREITAITAEVGSNKHEVDIAITSVKDEMGSINKESIKSIMSDIDWIKSQIQIVQGEKENLVDLVRVLSEKIDGEIDERRENVERDIANVIDHVDKEITAIRSVIGSKKDRLDMMIRSVKEDIQSINQNSIKSINGDINCIKSLMQSIQALAGLGQIDASCEWTIDEDVGNTGWSQGDRTIEYFTGVVYPYKYRLESWNYPDDKLWIWLYIYPGTIDAQFPWPFSGKAAITVSDRSKHEMLKNVTMQCKIRKPVDNHYSSALFEFSHSSLIKNGLDLAHGVNVWCVVVPTCANSGIDDTNNVLTDI